MTRTLRVAFTPTLLAALFACGGCAEGTGGGEVGQGPTNASVVPAPPAEGVEARKSEGDVTSPSIREIMIKLTKGPNSLTPVLGKELKDNPPPWETIQGQTKEFAQLAAALENNEPPKGSKKSWAELTADYAGSAAELDRAAQARDSAAALAAHRQLSESCRSCHQEHRKMGPGRGGPPGFGPPPGGPGSGPPPGGPGFGPPPEGPPPGGPPPQ
jgi:hypothetical protein